MCGEPEIMSYKKSGTTQAPLFYFNDRGGTRTHDQSIKSRLLYH